jgi:hypothetical protein
MEIIFKKDGIILESFTEIELGEKEEELKIKYDNSSIKSYEIIFKKGTKVKDVHDLGDLTPNECSSLILTLEGEIDNQLEEIREYFKNAITVKGSHGIYKDRIYTPLLNTLEFDEETEAIYCESLEPHTDCCLWSKEFGYAKIFNTK